MHIYYVTFLSYLYHVFIYIYIYIYTYSLHISLVYTICLTYIIYILIPSIYHIRPLQALRVFRDGVALGYETTLLPSFTTDHYTLTSIGAGQYSTHNPYTSTSTSNNIFEAPTTEENFISKLEYYAISLQKKENEAFLSIFSKEIHAINGIITTNMSINETNANEILIPCIGNIDSRCINSAIILLSLLFSKQSIEYQEKAIQLCSQALIQFNNKNQKEKIILFSSISEEERKRKERMHSSTIKNVLTTLCMIIQYYPIQTTTSSSTSGSSTTANNNNTTNNNNNTSSSNNNNDIVWYHTIITILYDMLNNNSYVVRSACSNSLKIFSNKISNISIINIISTKIRSIIMSSLEKKVIDSSSALDNTGYLVALSSLYLACKNEEIHLKSLISTVIIML